MGFVWLLLSLAVIAACGLLFWQPLLSALGRALVENDAVQKAKASVVLGGDGNGVRIITAAQLAQAGYVPYAIVDGPKTLVGYESDMSIAFAEHSGYPAAMFHALPLPPQVNSTRTEAVFVGTHLKQHDIDKILLVTSNYHTHRAAYLFRKMNPGLDVIAIAAADPDYDPNSWWTNRMGQKTFVMEWIKTVATYLGL